MGRPRPRISVEFPLVGSCREQPAFRRQSGEVSTAHFCSGRTQADRLERLPKLDSLPERSSSHRHNRMGNRRVRRPPRRERMQTISVEETVGRIPNHASLLIGGYSSLVAVQIRVSGRED
jgi:hypothetical protein